MLHGEDRLSQVGRSYASLPQALDDSEQLYGAAVQRASAPATDTETAAAAALSPLRTTLPEAKPATQDLPAEPVVQTVPLYAADPGDHEKVLDAFFEEHRDWEKVRTWSDETTLANHKTQTLRAGFPPTPSWGRLRGPAAYDSPVSDRRGRRIAAGSTSFMRLVQPPPRESREILASPQCS